MKGSIKLMVLDVKRFFCESFSKDYWNFKTKEALISLWKLLEEVWKILWKLVGDYWILRKNYEKP